VRRCACGSTNLDAVGSLHPFAERGDHALFDQQIAFKIHAMLGIEQADAGKDESFGE
jgi:hypothetical protein